jgi:hypothetical protein
MNEASGPQDVLPPAFGLNEPPPPLALPGVGAVLPRPVPFEDREAFPGFWARVSGMFQLVFRNPMELFERVPLTEGLGAPWRFLLLLSVPAFLLVALVFFAAGLGIVLAALEEAGRTESRVLAAAMPFIFGAILLLMPVFSFLGMVVGGALNHFFLWLWGGLRPGVPTAQSIRAYGYAAAFIQLSGFIPILGLFIQIAGMVVIGMGMARMHRTATWRGVCAALTPLFLLLVGGFLLLLGIVALVLLKR